MDGILIPNFEGYFASREGKIFSMKTGREIKAHSDGRYMKVRLYCKALCGRKTVFVHTLVALAFHGYRPGLATINHKNCNKLDNRAENLEYISRTENMRHAVRMGCGVGRPRIYTRPSDKPAG